MMLLFGFFVILYAVLILLAVFGWLKLKEVRTLEGMPEHKISVIIAVRNEAENILNLLHDLSAQNYPAGLWEALIIDDHSEDETPILVKKFAASSDLNVKLLSLENSIVSGKKAAIAYGVEVATGSLLVFTDGDCRVQKNWLALLEQQFRNGKVKFVSGAVVLSPANSIFGRIQMLEFSSLIGAGAAAIALQTPAMCNGANLAYLKETFLEVNGFDGNQHVASGDDEFLMHKIAAGNPAHIRFLKAKEAVVYTKPVRDMKMFISQRIRWASKWKHYQNKASGFTALVVFAANLTVFAGAFLVSCGLISGKEFWYLFGVKTGVDILFLFLVLKFFGRAAYLVYVIPLQIVYVPYVLFCALAGLKGSYHWKSRKIRTV